MPSKKTADNCIDRVLHENNTIMLKIYNKIETCSFITHINKHKTKPNKVNKKKIP